MEIEINKLRDIDIEVYKEPKDMSMRREGEEACKIVI